MCGKNFFSKLSTCDIRFLTRLVSYQHLVDNFVNMLITF